MLPASKMGAPIVGPILMETFSPLILLRTRYSNLTHLSVLSLFSAEKALRTVGAGGLGHGQSFGDSGMKSINQCTFALDMGRTLVILAWKLINQSFISVHWLLAWVI